MRPGNKIEHGFRWYGPGGHAEFGDADPIPIESIRQMLGISHIVTSLHGKKAGELWSKDVIARMMDIIGENGLELAGIEPLAIHEDILLGNPDWERHTDTYCENLQRLGEAGVRMVTYILMPVFDWIRTELEKPLSNGTTVLAYDAADLANLNLVDGLPGWGKVHSAEEITRYQEQYSSLGHNGMFDNYARFMARIIPVAEASGIRLAVHPDDPGFDVLGLPRIVKNAEDLWRILSISDSPNHGLCFCFGSLGTNRSNNLRAMWREFLPRTNFIHLRQVIHTGGHTEEDAAFHEAPHNQGDLLVDALHHLSVTDIEQPIPLRVDHGPMHSTDVGRPGYGEKGRSQAAAWVDGVLSLADYLAQ